MEKNNGGVGGIGPSFNLGIGGTGLARGSSDNTGNASQQPSAL